MGTSGREKKNLVQYTSSSLIQVSRSFEIQEWFLKNMFFTASTQSPLPTDCMLTRLALKS